MTKQEEKIIAYLQGRHWRYTKIKGNGYSKWMTQDEMKNDSRWIGPEIERWDIEHIREGILKSIRVNFKL